VVVNVCLETDEAMLLGVETHVCEIQLLLQSMQVR
jgi:hypothetical protein